MNRRGIFILDFNREQTELSHVVEESMDWIERLLQDAKFLAWVGISASKIYGPYIFKTTVNQHSYLDMLQIFFGKSIFRLRTTNSTTFNRMELLRTQPPRSKSGWSPSSSQWPPRSPYLNPCDFYYWFIQRIRSLFLCQNKSRNWKRTSREK